MREIGLLLLFISSTYEAAVTIFCLTFFLGEKQDKKSYITCGAILVLCGVVKEYFLIIHQYNIQLINIISLTTPFITFVSILVIFRGSSIKKVFFLCMYFFIASTCNLLYIIVFSFIFSSESIYSLVYSTQTPIYLEISKIILITEILIIAYPILKFLRNLNIIKSAKNLIQFLPLPICGSVLIEIFSGMFLEEKVSVFVLLLIVFLSFLVILCFFFFAKELSEKERDKQKLDFYEEEMRRQLTYNDELNDHYQEMKKLRHDFRNHLQVAYGAMQSGNLETAKNYLDDIDRTIDEADTCFCENTVINILLCEKIKAAKAKGIDCDCKVVLKNDVGIKQIYLASIFSNMLDNAIRA